MLERKRRGRKFLEKGGQPASEAGHHGLRWDQIRFCVSEDLIEVEYVLDWAVGDSRLRT